MAGTARKVTARHLFISAGGWKKEKGSVCLVCLSGGHGCEIVFQSREVVRPARACVVDVAPHHTAVSHRECCATCRGLRSPRVRERRRRRRVPRTTRSRSAATRPRGGSTHFALKISISPRPHEDGGDAPISSSTPPPDMRRRDIRVGAFAARRARVRSAVRADIVPTRGMQM